MNIIGFYIFEIPSGLVLNMMFVPPREYAVPSDEATAIILFVIASYFL
jgi:hypothetical protein